MSLGAVYSAIHALREVLNYYALILSTLGKKIP